MNIDEIIIASLTGEASQEELATLQEWRAADLRNEREYRARVNAWEMFGALVGADEERPLHSAELISRLEDGVAADDSRRESEPRPRPSGTIGGVRVSWRRLGFAASVILSLAAGSAAGYWMRSEPYGPRTLVTGTNEVATVTLADETIVRLAPGSRLEFPESSRQRQVSLTGRAYFAVSHMDGEPFRVRLPTGTIEVLGTRFEVQSGDRAARVAVVEGEVRMVGGGGGRVTVSPNEVARLTDRGQLDVDRVEDVFQVIDWLGRFLAFESTPLDEVAHEFRTRFGVEFDITDEDLADRTVTGWFSDLSVEEMIGGICAVVEAECVMRDRGVRMAPRSLEPHTDSPGSVPFNSVP